MNPDFNAWASQIPWVPLGIVAAAVVFLGISAVLKKKRQSGLTEKLAAGALVVDVRSPAEFSAGHYPGAVNHPVDKLEQSMKKLGPADRPLVVHCASGARSARAAQMLRNAGFTDVTDAGGMGNLPR